MKATTFKNVLIASLLIFTGAQALAGAVPLSHEKITRAVYNSETGMVEVTVRSNNACNYSSADSALIPKKTTKTTVPTTNYDLVMMSTRMLCPDKPETVVLEIPFTRVHGVGKIYLNGRGVKIEGLDESMPKRLQARSHRTHPQGYVPAAPSAPNAGRE